MDRLENLLACECNKTCADCHDSTVQYASLTFGVFLCELCARAHQSLDADVRSLPASKNNYSSLNSGWSVDAIARLVNHEGNNAVNERLEAELPIYFRRPWPGVSCPDFLREAFIKSKYIHEEFSKGAASRGVQCNFACTHKSGILLKKLRDNNSFCERLFELSVEGNFLRYFVRAGDPEPKQTLNLERLNITFIKSADFDLPPHTALIQFVQDDLTRQMFVRSEDSRTIVIWYNAIRFGKYHRLCLGLAGMGLSTSATEVPKSLTRDVDLAGWLLKTGPRKKDAWRRRWCMLIHRHLLYSDAQQAPFAKGEIFVGSYKENYTIKKGTPEGWKRHTGYAFTIYTFHRAFVFVAETEAEQEQWVSALERIVSIPPTFDESKQAAMVPGKRASTFDYLKKS